MSSPSEGGIPVLSLIMPFALLPLIGFWNDGRLFVELLAGIIQLIPLFYSGIDTNEYDVFKELGLTLLSQWMASI